MKARSIPELIRDLTAEARAKRQYSNRARFHLLWEDKFRELGEGQDAGNCHWAAVIAGHAAWAEEMDPDPC